MSLSQKKHQLAYFVSHPIQYQAPLLKMLSSQEDIELTVYFLSDVSTKQYSDVGFGKDIVWDVPLLEGYKHDFLRSSFKPGDFTLNNPSVRLSSVRKALLSKKWDAVWIHGYANLALLYLTYLCRRHKVPLMLRGESNLVCTSRGPLKHFFMQIFLPQFRAFLTIGSDNKAYYKHYGIADDKLFMVPYAVDNAFFQTQAQSAGSPVQTQKSKTIALYASKFIERKNPLLLLQAFNDLPASTRSESELWFIGDGELRPAMEAFIASNQLDSQVKLLGFKNQTELPAYFAQCDVFILPSEREPFGLVINEAMNQSKAIITTNEVGAASDLVHPGQNGWVVQAGSRRALTNALADAFADRDQLLEMGKASLQIIDRWDYSADIKGIRSALDSITAD